MPIMLTRKDGPPTPFRNAEYIPFYYFIPKSILSRCGAELNAIPRNPQELFHNLPPVSSWRAICSGCSS